MADRKRRQTVGTNGGPRAAGQAPRTPPPAPTVPLGEALAWSEDDLDAFTSPEALAAASDEIAQAWRRDADPADRGLIDAAEVPPPSPDVDA